MKKKENKAIICIVGLGYVGLPFSRIKQANFVIIAVPTPVTRSKELDLSYVKSGAKIEQS